jgi:hypothetical protein
VAFDTSLQMFIPRKLNSLRRLFSDYGMRFLNELLCFLCCATQSPSFGHFGHNQSKEHVRLCMLYPTSLPRHSSRYVENLPEISCSFKKED